MERSRRRAARPAVGERVFGEFGEGVEFEVDVEIGLVEVVSVEREDKQARRPVQRVGGVPWSSFRCEGRWLVCWT